MEVFTIGHSNHSAEKFTALLKQHGITMLIDVRSKPRSRMPHFNRDALLHLVRSVGLTYLYGGNVLGGFSTYGVKTPLFIAKMDTILEHGAAGQRVAMMCSEGNPRECHRAGKLTAWLHRERQHVKTTHILPNGTLVDARQLEPEVLVPVRWHEFSPWGPDLLQPA